MLYDPKWEQRTKADPFTLGTLIAWLEKQPPDARYNYFCNGHCLLAQYFSQQGFDKITMFGESFTHGRDIPGSMGQTEARAAGWATNLPPHFNDVALRGVHTFGAALERARNLMR